MNTGHECNDYGTMSIHNVMSKDDHMYATFDGLVKDPTFDMTMGGEFSGHVTNLSTDKIDHAVEMLRRATDNLEDWNEQRKETVEEVCRKTEECSVQWKERADRIAARKENDE